MFLLPILIPAFNSSRPAFLFFFFLILFIYLFLVVRGLCFMRAFSPVVASGGFSLVVMQGLLFAVASLVAEHGLLSLQTSVALGLRSCGTQA